MSSSELLLIFCFAYVINGLHYFRSQTWITIKDALNDTSTCDHWYKSIFDGQIAGWDYCNKIRACRHFAILKCKEYGNDSVDSVEVGKKIMLSSEPQHVNFAINCYSRDKKLCGSLRASWLDVENLWFEHCRSSLLARSRMKRYNPACGGGGSGWNTGFVAPPPSLPFYGSPCRAKPRCGRPCGGCGGKASIGNTVVLITRKPPVTPPKPKIDKKIIGVIRAALIEVSNRSKSGTSMKIPAFTPSYRIVTSTSTRRTWPTTILTKKLWPTTRRSITTSKQRAMPPPPPPPAVNRPPQPPPPYRKPPDRKSLKEQRPSVANQIRGPVPPNQRVKKWPPTSSPAVPSVRRLPPPPKRAIPRGPSPGVVKKPPTWQLRTSPPISQLVPPPRRKPSQPRAPAPKETASGVQTIKQPVPVMRESLPVQPAASQPQEPLPRESSPGASITRRVPVWPPTSQTVPPVGRPPSQPRAPAPKETASGSETIKQPVPGAWASLPEQPAAPQPREPVPREPLPAESITRRVQAWPPMSQTVPPVRRPPSQPRALESKETASGTQTIRQPVALTPGVRASLPMQPAAPQPREPVPREPLPAESITRRVQAWPPMLQTVPPIRRPPSQPRAPAPKETASGTQTMRQPVPLTPGVRASLPMQPAAPQPRKPVPREPLPAESITRRVQAWPLISQTVPSVERPPSQPRAAAPRETVSGTQTINQSVSLMPGVRESLPAPPALLQQREPVPREPSPREPPVAITSPAQAWPPNSQTVPLMGWPPSLPQAPKRMSVLSEAQTSPLEPQAALPVQQLEMEDRTPLPTLPYVPSPIRPDAEPPLVLRTPLTEAQLPQSEALMPSRREEPLAASSAVQPMPEVLHEAQPRSRQEKVLLMPQAGAVVPSESTERLLAPQPEAQQTKNKVYREPVPGRQLALTPLSIDGASLSSVSKESIPSAAEIGVKKPTLPELPRGLGYSEPGSSSQSNLESILSILGKLKSNVEIFKGIEYRKGMNSDLFISQISERCKMLAQEKPSNELMGEEAIVLKQLQLRKQKQEMWCTFAQDVLQQRELCKLDPAKCKKAINERTSPDSDSSQKGKNPQHEELLQKLQEMQEQQKFIQQKINEQERLRNLESTQFNQKVDTMISEKNKSHALKLKKDILASRSRIQLISEAKSKLNILIVIVQGLKKEIEVMIEKKLEYETMLKKVDQDQDDNRKIECESIINYVSESHMEHDKMITELESVVEKLNNSIVEIEIEQESSGLQIGQQTWSTFVYYLQEASTTIKFFNHNHQLIHTNAENHVKNVDAKTIVQNIYQFVYVKGKADCEECLRSAKPST
uniref:Uncharacterized protein n=1 Tax=Romanomermis culicivorax TaxID=13658 RepID=A0A915HX86_ROMCU